MRFAVITAAVVLLAAYACGGTGPGDGDNVAGYVWLGNPYYSVGGMGGLALYNSITGTEIASFDKIGGKFFALYAMDSDYITGELYTSYYITQEDDWLGKFGADGELIWSFEPNRKITVLSYDCENDWLWVWPTPGLLIYKGSDGAEFFDFPDDYDVRYVTLIGASPSDDSAIICSYPSSGYKVIKYKGTGEKIWVKELEGFNLGPDLLTVDRKNGEFWITDSGGEIYKYSPEGEVIYEINVDGLKNSVDVDTERDILWVSVSSSDEIIRFDATTGERIDSVSDLRGVLQVDEYDGAALVLRNIAGTAYLIRLNPELTKEYEVYVNYELTDIKISKARYACIINE